MNRGDSYDLKIGERIIDVKSSKPSQGNMRLSPNEDWGVFESPLSKPMDYYLFVTVDIGRMEIWIVGAISKIELLKVGYWRTLHSNRGQVHKLSCLVHQTIPVEEWLELIDSYQAPSTISHIPVAKII